MAAKFKNTLLFDYLGNILKTKSLSLYKEHIEAIEFESSFVPYMVIRYLSMCGNPTVRNLILANQASLEKLPSKILYRFLLQNVPKQFNSFIKYIK